MLTNLVVLSVVLITNAQQAIVGEHQGKAVLAAQETVIQRTITLEDVVLRSNVTTNLIGFAFPKPATAPNQPSSPFSRGASTTNQVLSATNGPNPSLNTNSPAFRRRLEREQRMKPSTNAPSATTLEDDPRK